MYTSTDGSSVPRASRAHRLAVAALLACCTVLGLAGIDLVLPAVPGLPDALGGSLGLAQLVLAAFAAGTGVGLLLFGELGARFDHRLLLFWALLAYALLSWLGSVAASLPWLVGLRFFQGVAASCAAVVTPGMLRALFSEQAALRALGLLGSVESLAPAVAPLLGVWLLQVAGWQATFQVTAVLSLLLAVAVALARGAMPHITGNAAGGYRDLLCSFPFQRHALSQGLSVGGLLVFVFGMPTVITVGLDGSITDFIVMQVLGISTFILAANLSSRVVAWLGVEATIFRGSALSAAGALAMFAYAAAGGGNVTVIWLLFLPFNMGIGFRAPPGFYRALQASGGDDARASALVILSIMLITAGGTVLVAPVIADGLAPLALAALLPSLLSLLVLRLFPDASAVDRRA